jgi:hypothetical protein
MAGSFALITVEFFFMAAIVLYLIYHYKSPVVGKDVVISTFLAWTLGFAGIILLPYDLAVAFVLNEQMSSLLALWDVIYWR